MSKLSVMLVIALGVVGLGAIAFGAVRIVVAQMRAPAPAAAAPAPMPAGSDAPASTALAPNAYLIHDLVRSVMPAIVSLFLLIPSGVIVATKDRPAEHQKWATATISSIVTYWLR
jgi:hypothetical protein